MTNRDAVNEMTKMGGLGMLVLLASFVAAAEVSAQAAGVEMHYAYPQGAQQPVYPQQSGYGQPPSYGQPPGYGQPAYGQTAREPRTVTRQNMGLIISGAVVLGVGWLANIVIGMPAGTNPFSSGGGDPAWDGFRLTSLIPVAGPWIQLAIKPTDFSHDYWGSWLILDGIIQAAGAVLLVVGLATPSTQTIYADLGGGVELTVLPTVGPSHTGLALVGHF